MAEDILSGVFTSFGGWGGGFGTTILIVVVLALFAVLVFMIITLLKYKYTFIIRELANGRKIVFQDKARAYRDKKGVEYWKLLRRRELVPIPPKEAIDINTRGKFFVECYRTSEGQYFYLRDYADLDSSDPNFKPITHSDLTFLANKLQYAEERKRHSILEHLMPLAGGIIVIMAFVILVAFYGKIAEPFHKSQEIQVRNQQEINIALQTINDILDARQTLEEQNSNGQQQPLPPS